NTVDAAYSDHGYNDQSVILIKTAWNGSPVSKYIENTLVIVINFDGQVGKFMANGRIKDIKNWFFCIVISIGPIFSLYTLQCSAFYSVIYRLSLENSQSVSR
ncbi:hypothetical protein AVEN_115642-1, partial [Araneus ventricosus]